MSIHIGENRILTTISEEPFWTIVKAESVTSGDQVWFKVLRENYAKNQVMVARFHQSAETNLALHHNNILPVIQHGVEESVHFAVLQPFFGTKLSDLAKRHERLSEDRAVHIFLQICEALQFAHLRGVLHGALTSDCIYVDQEEQVVVTHFASEQLVDCALCELEDEIPLKIASFLAPERLGQVSPASVSSELYSLGVIFYHLLTGQMPFSGASLEELAHNQENQPESPKIHYPIVTPKTEKLIFQLLAKDPQDRFRNIASVIREYKPLSLKESEEFEDMGETQSSFLQRKVLAPLDQWARNFKIFSPTLVGSRRRATYFLLTLAAVIIVSAAVALFSEFGSTGRIRDQALYNEFITDEKESASSIPVAEIGSGQSPQGISEDEKRVVVAQKTYYGDSVAQSLLEKNSQISDALIKPSNTDRNDSSGGSFAAQSESAINASQSEKASLERSINSSSLPASLIISVLADSQSTSADIYLNGEYSGQSRAHSPFRLHGAAAEKTYDLRIEKSGYKTWQQRVFVRNQDSLRIIANLELRPDAVRRFTFALVDFADRVIIDNRLPSHPLPFEADLALGLHFLKYFDSSSSVSWEKQVFLDMDSDRIIRFDAERIGHGEVAVVLENAAQYGYAYVSIDGSDGKNQTTPWRAKLPVGRHKIRAFRDGFETVPIDTVVNVPLNREIVITFRLNRKQ
jgi:serine/threonine protein kinase